MKSGRRGLKDREIGIARIITARPLSEYEEKRIAPANNFTTPLRVRKHKTPEIRFCWLYEAERKMGKQGFLIPRLVIGLPHKEYENRNTENTAFAGR